MEIPLSTFGKGVQCHFHADFLGWQLFASFWGRKMSFLAGIPLGSRRDRWGDSMPAPAQRVGPMGMCQASYGTAASSWTKSLLLKSFLQPMFIKYLPSDTGLHVGNASVGNASCSCFSEGAQQQQQQKEHQFVRSV